MACRSVASLPDHVLTRELSLLVLQELTATSRLLAHLAEFDARRLYVPAGYPSMYLYCVDALHLSEDAAWKRIQSARAAQRFPAILEALEAGRLHLAAVVMLAPHLTPENAGELIANSTHKSKAQIALLLAQRFPRPDAPTQVLAIAAPVDTNPPATGPEGPREPRRALAAPEVTTPEPAPGQVGMTFRSQAGAAAAGTATPAPRSRVEPLSPGRFALQVTLPQVTHDKLRRVQELLGHTVRSGDIAQVLDRALELALRHLEHQRNAATSKPRLGRSHASGRYVPAEIRRQVWRRDGGQCTYTSDQGHRCEARSSLELDHVRPIARGGPTSETNLRLRCRAHNQLAAEQVYGKRFMDAKRQAAQMRGSDARERQPADMARSPV